jgi:hypothetical protein
MFDFGRTSNEAKTKKNVTDHPKWSVYLASRRSDPNFCGQANISKTLFPPEIVSDPVGLNAYEKTGAPQYWMHCWIESRGITSFHSIQLPQARKSVAETMSKSRKEKIMEMLVAEPDDQFLRYSLAMELQKEDAVTEGETLFRGLMADPTPHVPSFFMLAQMLVRNDRTPDAIPVLEAGIQQARQQKDTHAASEMSEFLSMLE